MEEEPPGNHENVSKAIKECSVVLTNILQEVNLEAKNSSPSKYTLSSDEEVVNDDFTEEEYVPSDSSETTSPSTDDDMSVKTITPQPFEPAVPFCESFSSPNVRRKLFIDEDVETVKILKSNSSGKGVSLPRMKKITASVKVFTGGKVMVETLSTLHKGLYTLSMFKAALPNSDGFYLKSYIFDKDQTEHSKCTWAEQKEHLGFLFRENQTLICEMSQCIPLNLTIEGREAMSELHNQHITALTMNPTDVDPLPSTKLRQHYCLFCGKLRTCMGRHLQKRHALEPEIAALKQISTEEKNKKLRAIRLEGDKKYNSVVHTHNRISVRRPLSQNITDSIHCSNCNGLFAKKNFARHHLRCFKRLPDRKRRRNLAATVDQNLLTETSDEKLMEILLTDMINDEIGVIAKNEPTIVLLGIHLYRINPEQRHLDNTRSQMRRCARVFHIIKQINPKITTFAECFHPSKYRLLMTAIQIMTGKTNEHQSLQTPSLALQFGPLLTTIAGRLKIALLQQNVPDEDPRLITLRNFENLHKQEFKNEITKQALKSASLKKVKNTKHIPTQEDTRTFNIYIKQIINDCVTKLQKELFDLQTWRRLGECILCQIMVYNRRRPGETSRLLLEDYNTRSQLESENLKYLNRLQRILALKFKFMFVLGKRSRPLNLLLKPEHQESLMVYLSFRDAAGIPGDNKYLFAYHCKTGYISASFALRKLVKCANLKYPESFTGTYLRKQVATQAQILDLNKNEMQHVADFMGHDMSVHLSHYRQNDPSINILKISPFLSVMDGDDNIEKFRGKRLEDLLLQQKEQANDLDEDETDLAMNSDDVDKVENDLQMDSDFGKNNNPSLPPTFKQKRNTRNLKQCTPKKSPKKTTIAQIMQTLSPASPEKRGRRSFSAREICIMQQKLGHYISSGKLAPLSDCNNLVEKNKNVFSGRCGRDLYNWAQYQRNKRKTQYTT